MVILYICNRDVLGAKPFMGYPEYFEGLLSYSRKGKEQYLKIHLIRLQIRFN